jgi:glyoxylase-like metal-dependent hydrolase (beta-lactamase superfamily II)
MRRLQALGALVVIGVLSVSVQALQQPPLVASKTLEVEKLRDNLFILKNDSSGGNTAVFIQANGVTLVDTKNPGWGGTILAKVKELTPKPVTMIINTHTHGDHVSGNVEFPPTVDVVTHANTQDNMKKLGIFGENQGRGLPKRTFTDRMTIGSGADQIDLRYFGRGHTNGDAWVIFPALRAVHAGDIFARKGIPFLDGTSGGSGVEMPDTLAKAAAAFTNIDSIITGHSTVMTVNDLKEYAEFNRDFLNAVREGKRAGQTVNQFIANWKIPEKYRNYDPDPKRLPGNVELLFKELP